MSNKNFRFSRHLKLWEEQNKLLKRTIIATLLFAILLLIKVLNPLTKITHNTTAVEREIQEYTEQRKTFGQLQENLTEVSKTLNQVQKTVQKQPWIKEKDELIRKFRRMQEDNRRRPTQKEIQDTANVTIHNIANLVRESVIAPLNESLKKHPDVRKNLPQITQWTNGLRENMDRWEQNHIDMEWYGTVHEKSREMHELTQSLKDQLVNLPQIIRSEKEKIQTHSRELRQQTIELSQKITDREKYLDDLNGQMQQILPAWLRGMLGVEDMMQLFPLFILMLEIYIFYLSIMLSRHYFFVAKHVNLSDEDKKDLSCSTLWTMTDRGKVGTGLTMAAYLVFTLVMFGFFEWGCLLLHRWLLTTSEINWYSEIVSGKYFLWAGRIVFCVFIGIFVALPVYISKFKKL